MYIWMKDLEYPRHYDQYYSEAFGHTPRDRRLQDHAPNVKVPVKERSPYVKEQSLFLNTK